MDRFLELFGHFIEFAYAIWDRIVLRGYYDRLQRPENIVYFFRDVCGISCITPKVLAHRTERYRKWVEGYARRRRIPIIAAPKGERKEDFVERYYRRFRRTEGVVVILKSMEQGPSFISYEPRFSRRAVTTIASSSARMGNSSNTITSTSSIRSWVR